VGARRGWREARQGAVTSRAGRGCCGPRWYTRRRQLQTRSSCSLVGRAPLRQPAASHADRARSVGEGFFCLRRLPPRGSNTLQCSQAGSCSTRRDPSVCCFQRTRRWESTKAAPLHCKSSPPFRNSAANPKVHFKPSAGQWARGRGQRGPIIVRAGGEGAPPLSSRWRARPRPKVSAHQFLRRQQRSNKSAASCRTCCVCARHGAGAHGGRGCSWGFAQVTKDVRIK